MIGIDQGPIAIMAENYRSQSVWNRFMQIPVIQQGLQAAGFAPVTGVETDRAGTPREFTLQQNYPNPFNPETHIQFTVAQIGHLQLKVYDVTGRLVRVLADAEYQPGTYDVVLEATGLSSGVYFYELRAGMFAARKSMIVLK
jgi:hypothetical protein